MTGPPMLQLAAAPFPYAGELAAALSALVWASAGVVFAKLSPGVSAAAMNLGKNLSAALCFAVLMLVTTFSIWPASVEPEALLCFLASGVVGLALCDTFLLRSLQAIGPQRMSLLMCLAPVLVALGALAPPFSERPPIIVWTGMGVCVLGIVFAITEKRDEAIPAARRLAGIRYGLLAAALQAAAVMLARQGQSLSETPALHGATVRMFAGTGALIVMGLVGRHLRPWLRQILKPGVWWQLFVASFFGTFLGIWLNQIGLDWAQHTGVATVLNSLMPVYLIPLGALFLGDRIGWRGKVATLLALLGISLMALGA